MRICHFHAQNDSFVLNKHFLVQTITITFIYLLALFIVQNLKKLFQQIQSYEDVPFWAQNGPFAPNKYFFRKLLILILIYLLAPFLAQNLKKNSSSGSRVMRMHNFWAQNGPFPQMRIFSENLLISLVSFIHAYLHAENQSQMLIY